MSAHRQHYFDVNPPSGPAAKPTLLQKICFGDAEPLPAGGVIAVGIMVLFVLIMGVSSLVKLSLKPDVTVTPIHQPAVQVFDLSQLTAEEARIEGFRAGVATATEQGCSLLLSSPVAPR